MSFKTWEEAYNKQRELSVDGFLQGWDSEVESKVKEISNVPFFVYNVVCLITNLNSIGSRHISFGVTKDKKWVRIITDNVVRGYQRFNSLEELIMGDESANIIVDNIDELMRIFEFLKTGEVEEQSVSEFEDVEETKNIQDAYNSYIEEEHEEKYKQFRITYSDNLESSERKYLIIADEKQAEKTYQSLLEQKYKYVELAEMKKQHIDFS